jgi:hypothetical protein
VISKNSRAHNSHNQDSKMMISWGCVLWIECRESDTSMCGSWKFRGDEEIGIMAMARSDDLLVDFGFNYNF